MFFIFYYKHLVVCILHIKTFCCSSLFVSHTLYILLLVGPDFMIFSEFLMINWDHGVKGMSFTCLKELLIFIW
jgi:hypothetical protein